MGLTAWLIIAGLSTAVGLMMALLLKHAKEEAAQEELNKVAHEVLEETKYQAGRAVERRTDADVVHSLREKAAAKRKR